MAPRFRWKSHSRRLASRRPSIAFHYVNRKPIGRAVMPSRSVFLCRSTTGSVTGRRAPCGPRRRDALWEDVFIVPAVLDCRRLVRFLRFLGLDIGWTVQAFHFDGRQGEDAVQTIP